VSKIPDEYKDPKPVAAPAANNKRKRTTDQPPATDNSTATEDGTASAKPLTKPKSEDDRISVIKRIKAWHSDPDLNEHLLNHGYDGSKLNYSRMSKQEALTRENLYADTFSNNPLIPKVPLIVSKVTQAIETLARYADDKLNLGSNLNNLQSEVDDPEMHKLAKAAAMEMHLPNIAMSACTQYTMAYLYKMSNVYYLNSFGSDSVKQIKEKNVPSDLIEKYKHL
jgi:hypothetical protein